MKTTIIKNCRDAIIIEVLKLILEEHNTKINVFQNRLGLTYTQAKTYVKILKKAGIYSANNHYSMIVSEDGKLKRCYTPFRILISDDELRELISELEAHYSKPQGNFFNL